VEKCIASTASAKELAAIVVMVTGYGAVEVIVMSRELS
jgi:hypothetical protein